MPNPFGAPEISVKELVAKQQAGEEFIWIDVREPQEYAAAQIPDENIVYIPLSQVAEKQLDAIPDTVQQAKDAEVIIFCHHGMRSAQMVMWLSQQGWNNALNMEGGIQAWADEIDPSVGVY